jgi:hypothetical protein
MRKPDAAEGGCAFRSDRSIPKNVIPKQEPANPSRLA